MSSHAPQQGWDDLYSNIGPFGSACGAIIICNNELSSYMNRHKSKWLLYSSHKLNGSIVNYSYISIKITERHCVVTLFYAAASTNK